MNKKDEALKMAIDFMGTLTIDVGIKTWNEKHRKEAIQACKEALEQPTQEPVAFRNKNTGEFCTGGFLLNHGWDKEWIKLYTHPKEWQGLSDEEIKSIYLEVGVMEFKDVVKMIEQKLKEKNS